MLANCRFCRKKFKQKIFNYRYCQSTPECKEAGTEAKNILIKKAMEKVKVSRGNKSRQETKVLSEKLKTLSQYEAEAKKSFQHYIRLRDKYLPCISFGNPNPTDWCGSHYFSSGMYSGLMFDERNCHGACNTYCNKYLSGNLIEYRKGLISRYGALFVEKLESEADSKRNKKYTKEELIAKKLNYDIKIKELK